jgi:hypothetical protein
MGKVRCRVVEKNGHEIVEEIHKVIVGRFKMGDVDDPDLYAAQPLWEWQQSDKGKFIMENSTEQPEWHRRVDHLTYGYEYVIIAELEKKKLSEFYLRFGTNHA